jgi:hypothetical protein
MENKIKDARFIPIYDAIKDIVEKLDKITFMDPLNRWTFAYYCASTQWINKMKRFPLLYLSGPTGTGKTSVEEFACDICNMSTEYPTPLDVHGSSIPAIREQFGKSRWYTIVLDEGDNKYFKDFEGLLTERYGIMGSQSRRQKTGKDWTDITTFVYGATVIGKREPFHDQALVGRCIQIRTKMLPDDVKRDFIRAEDLTVSEVKDITDCLHALTTITPIRREEILDFFPPHSSDRVKDTYYPLIALAMMCNDDDYVNHMKEQLQVASDLQKDGQKFEMTSTILQCACYLCGHEGKDGEQEFIIRPIDVRHELIPEIKRVTYTELGTFYVDQVLRGTFGFDVHSANSRNCLYMDWPHLVAAMRQINWTDDVIMKAWEKINTDPKEVAFQKKMHDLDEVRNMMKKDHDKEMRGPVDPWALSPE